jgi:hypothetical protein
MSWWITGADAFKRKRIDRKKEKFRGKIYYRKIDTKKTRTLYFQLSGESGRLLQFARVGIPICDFEVIQVPFESGETREYARVWKIMF